MGKTGKEKRNVSILGRSFTGKVAVFAIAMLFITTAFSAANITNPEANTPQKNMPLGITWDATISFSNPGGQSDTVVFGEAPDAHGGQPADAYDVAKPPAPIEPYIRAYFKDNLPTPYNLLWMDYRQYPDSDKVWNLSIFWSSEDGGSTPTAITISWNTDQISLSEYDTIILDDNSGNPLVNMKTTGHYTYTSPDDTITQFKIQCSGTLPPNQPPLKPQAPSGEANGKINVEYTYTSSTTDPNGDQVSYWFDWGDGTNSGWVGPYASGATGSAKHIWTVKGNFNIKVKAKDIRDAESNYSDSLPIKMPTSKSFGHSGAHTIREYIDLLLRIVRGEQRDENLPYFFLQTSASPWR